MVDDKMPKGRKRNNGAGEGGKRKINGARRESKMVHLHRRSAK